MRARASNVMIGTLTLALIGGSLGAFLGYQKLAGAKQKTAFRVVFEGSASGLRKGGSVNFAGIRVGEVVSLKLDHPRRVVALAMIDGNTPVEKRHAGRPGISGADGHCRDLLYRRIRRGAAAEKGRRTAFPN